MSTSTVNDEIITTAATEPGTGPVAGAAGTTTAPAGVADHTGGVPAPRRPHSSPPRRPTALLVG